MLSLREILDDFRQWHALPEDAAIDVASQTDEGSTPLHVMAMLGDGKAIAMLAAAGAPLDAADEDGNTALHEAVQGRHATAVAALLEAGADAQAINVEGQTPLALAELGGYEPVLSLLR